MILTVLAMIVIGLIAGALARLIVPGRDEMSIPATVLLGIVGSFVGGLLASLLFGGDLIRPTGLLGSVLGAVIALLIYNKVTDDQHANV